MSDDRNKPPPDDVTMRIPSAQPSNTQMARAWKEGGEVDRHVGQVLGGYEVLRRVAEGGMGVIYEGRHAKLGRRGAIKVLKPEYCQSEDVVERFYQEARAVNEIHHENIVDIYDFGREADGRVFFIMEFLEGESLGARLSRGTLSFAEAMAILEQVVRALKAAHEKGFVHRDLKPDNIWLKHRDDGGVDVKLLDFGIAKLVGLEGVKEKLTRTGAIIGTPTYMSPEQINGGPAIDGRTDIYSLGIIIYELFTGTTPFQGEALAAIMMGHLFNEPPPLTNLNPALGVPDGVQQIVARMLAKNPDERYATVSDVLSDLRSVAQNREPTVVSKLDRERPRSIATGTPRTEPSATAPAIAPPRRSPFVVPLVALGAIGAAVAAFVVLGSGKKATPPTTPVTTQPNTPPAPTPGPDTTTPPPAPAVDLEKVGHDAKVVLRESLGHNEPRVRVHGADGVGAVKDGESEPRLLELVASDPDLEVRGHAASALGALSAMAARKPLAVAEKKAEPPLRVWYAGALARLGDRDARKRLIKYAKDDDLAVAFRAALALADVSEGGDRDAIAALMRLAAREAELNDVAPYAGAVLLGKLAALREDRARTLLYQLLEDKNERSRLAAAEGLARLGDEAALAPLKKTLDDTSSPNRLVAAVALIPLGDYAGFDLLTEKLADPDPERRRLAARGLGEIGETGSVAALVGLLADPDPTVRVASAVSLVFIVGLDPKLLAQASVDWARGALDSEDWAVRAAGAGVLGDMVEEDAVPLLAQALVDDDAKVRRSAARSARKMKSPAAAKAIADVVIAEKDRDVKADQVRALGTIGDAVAKPVLEQLASESGALGVLASGALIAVGDASASARLATAITDRHGDVREAAVEASVLAKNPVVVPTLAVGARDRTFLIRFAAAEGLAGYQAEKAVAQPVLEEGLAQRDVSFQARARAALRALGVSPAGGVTPDELLASPDPEVRLGATHEITQMPWAEARPFVRRMLADPDARVRARGLDVVETGETTQRPDAIKLYKLSADDLDPGLRARARARLARITPATMTAVAPAAPTTPTTPAITPPAPTPPAIDAAVPATVDTQAVDAAAALAAEARDEATTAIRELETISTEVTAAVAQPADDDRAIAKVKNLARSARTVRDRVKAASAKAADAAEAAAKAARTTPSDEATARAGQAKALAEEVAQMSKDAIAASDKLDARADDYASSETGDVEMLVAGANTSIASGKLSEARRDLDKAAAQASASGESYPEIKLSYGRLYDAMAKRARVPAEKLRLLEKAKQSYDAFAERGSGGKVVRARERSEELAEEITELEGASP